MNWLIGWPTRWQNLTRRSKPRLLLAFLLLSPLPLGGLAWLHLSAFERTLHETTLTNLSSIADKKTDQINDYIDERLASSLLLAQLVIPRLLLQKHPASPTRGNRLTTRGISLDLDNFFAPLMRSANFYDLLLIDAGGNIIFSVRKESDLGTNLNTGPYRDTQLAHAHREAMALLNHQITPAGTYAPSGDKAAIFFVNPVVEDGKVLGTLALQLDLEKLTAVTNDVTGLGNTGETVLAQSQGDQVLYVGPLRHVPDAAFHRLIPLAQAPPPMRSGLNGEHGRGLTQDYAKRDVVAAWRHLPALDWGMVVKIDAAEAFAPLQRVRNTSLAALAALLTLSSAIALLFAHQQRRLEEQVIERTCALQESETTLKRAQAVARLGSWHLDLARNRLTWSDETCRIFGTPSGMPLDYEDFIAHVHPDDRQSVNDGWQAALKGAAYDITHRIVVRDEVRWVRELAEFLFDEQGNFHAATGTVHDVTEIYRAKEEAEAANRAKSAFLANMSHEIRTPMNAILGLTQLVLESPMEPRQQDFLAKALNSGRALLGLLNDILDYSKIEAGRLEISREPFSVETVLHEVGNLFAARLAEKGLVLNFDIAANLPATVLGDALRLNQVLANLVSNAIKFTEHGEIRVRVEIVDTTTVAEQNDTLTLCFAVRDTGIGLDKETAHRLFQPFTQADGGITRKYGGTGLGLAICRTLVALMGGSIDATGEPGAGATFSFSIRVKRDAAHASRNPHRKKSALAGRHFNGARILLAEDNPTNRFVMTELLKKLGIMAICAHDGAEAVAAIAAKQADTFSAVLMDLHMPVMDGLEAARHIQALPQGARLPIIALTAAVMKEDRERCRQAGMVNFVPKPVDLQEISDVLAQYLPFSIVPLPVEPVVVPTVQPDPAAVASMLERLRPYLEERELVPDDLLEALHLLAQTQPSGELLNRLLRNLGDFDHDGALATLTQITALANSA